MWRRKDEGRREGVQREGRRKERGCGEGGTREGERVWRGRDEGRREGVEREGRGKERGCGEGGTKEGERVWSGRDEGRCGEGGSREASRVWGGRDDGVERKRDTYLPPALRALIALVWVACGWVTRGTFSETVSSVNASVDILRLLVWYRSTRCGQTGQCSSYIVLYYLRENINLCREQPRRVVLTWTTRL